MRNISEATALQNKLTSCSRPNELLLPPELPEHSMGTASHGATNSVLSRTAALRTSSALWAPRKRPAQHYWEQMQKGLDGNPS